MTQWYGAREMWQLGAVPVYIPVLLLAHGGAVLLYPLKFRMVMGLAFVKEM